MHLHPPCRPVWILLLPILCVLSAPPVRGQGRPPTPVIVSDVVQKKIHSEVNLIGTVQPRRSSLVASETEGKVVTRFQDAGQTVKSGEAIFRLDNDRLRASLVEALADVELHLFNHTHSLDLYQQGAIPEQSLHDAVYQLARARAKREDLESRLEALDIRAPFDGHIVQTLTEVGEWVGRGDGIARIISTDTVRVYVNVPETYIDRLRVGDGAEVTVKALGSTPLSGQIVAVLAEGYAESHTFPVVVEVQNPGNHIRSHMSAKVRFKIQQPEAVLLVHKDALVNSPRGQVVYLVVDGKAVSRVLKPGMAYNGYVAVEGDLKPGDQAIVRGNERLRDGQAVKVLRKQQ